MPTTIRQTFRLLSTAFLFSFFLFPFAVGASSITHRDDVVRMSAPTTVVEVDAGRLNGDPVRLAWAPDGSQLYLRSVQRDRFANEKFFHFLVTLPGGKVEKVDQAPAWAETYWSWKSAPKHPGDATFAIALDSRRETVKPTGAPSPVGQMQSDPSANAGDRTTGTSVAQVAGVVAGTQTAVVHTMRVKGEIVGRWVNESIIPGTTFGWAPKGVGLIAYADMNRKLTIMSNEGRKQDVDGTRDVRLPAWSDDGRRLAYVEAGKKKSVVKVVEVETAR
jgi:hypothetical protein